MKYPLPGYPPYILRFGLLFVVLSLGAWGCIGAPVAQAQPVHPDVPGCAFRGGNNASFIISNPASRGIRTGDVVSVTTPRAGQAQCLGGAVADGGNMAFAVWQDNPMTAATDGARAGDPLTLAVSRTGRDSYAADLSTEYEPDEVWIALPCSAETCPPNDSLAAAVEAALAYINELEGQVEELGNQNAALEQAVASLQQQLDAASESNDALLVQIAELETENAALTQEVGRLQGLLDAAPNAEEFAALQAENVELAATIAGYQDAVSPLLLWFFNLPPDRPQ